MLFFSPWFNGIIGFGEEDHGGRVPFLSYIEGMYYLHDVIIDVDLNALAEVVFFRFIQCKRIALTPVIAI